MANYFRCDNATKAIVNGGTSPNEDDAWKQPAEAGTTLFVVPDGLVDSAFSVTPDFTKLKAYYRETINQGAEAVFEAYATTIKGQDRRYLLKQTEAIAYIPGDEASHPTKYPFMIAEATVRTALTGSNVSVSQVASEILAQVSASITPEATVEAYRVAKRMDVQNATTLPDIVAAADVDWEAILAAL